MHLFPDTTVLSNFAAVRRMDLLKEFLGDHGEWVESIEAETRKSMAYHPALDQIFAEGWFGPGLALDQGNEPDLVERFRLTEMYGDPNLPLQHLGESETYVLLKHRAEFSASTFITDDHDAHRIAERYGLHVCDTFDIATALVGRYSLTGDDAVSLLADMEQAGRNLRRVATKPSDFPI